MAEKKPENFKLEELTAFLPMLENVSFDVSDKIITDIKKEIENKILGSNRIRLNTEDCSTFFNITIDYRGKSIIWNNPDYDFIFGRFLIYSGKLVTVSKGRAISSARTAVFCLGMTDDKNGDENIEYVNNLCSKYGISFPEPEEGSGPTVEPKPKQKKEKTEAQKKEERKQRLSAVPTGELPVTATSPATQLPTPKSVQGDADPQDKTPATGTNDNNDIAEIHVFEPLTLNDVLETPPLDFITDNLIVRNTVNVFFAPAKTGKTYLCLYYAICMAKGIPFLGLETHLKRNVGYLNLDMFRGGFNDRVKQVIRGFNPNSTHDDISDILNRLRIIDREAIRTARGNTPNFFEYKYLDDLKLFIEVNDIEFLFIDTFSRIRAGSKENDNDHMGLVLQNAEEFFTPLQCGSLFIHHTGKDQTTIRGAQALIDNAEFVFGLRKVNNSNKHLQLFSDTPRYTDTFELDIYPVFQHSTNDETGARIADSYFLTAVNPDDDNSDIIDFLKAKGNPYLSKKSIALGVGGRYEDRLKEVDSMFAQNKLERVQAGRGFNYRLKSV